MGVAATRPPAIPRVQTDPANPPFLETALVLLFDSMFNVNVPMPLLSVASKLI
jgi:hypothetical protein